MEEEFTLWGNTYLVDYTYSFDKVSSEYSVEIHSVNGGSPKDTNINETVLNALHTEIITYEKQKAEDESLGL